MDQRKKESRKKASNVVIKEMKFRPKIDEHDYTTKTKHVERFLHDGIDVAIKGGAKQQALRAGRREVQRLNNLRRKTHVAHLVSFVQHGDFDA